MRIKQLVTSAAIGAAALGVAALTALAGLPARGFSISVSPATSAAKTNVVSVAFSTNAVPKATTGVVREGCYTSKDDVAAYIFAYGCLPTNFITKAEARRLGWTGGPLEPFARGKSIGGDYFGNYERKLPNGKYRECDIDTLRRSRGAKRIIFSSDRRIYYTDDHYQTFSRIERK